MHRNISKKIVVFDLDETLGYFVEFGIFWDLLYSFMKENSSNKEEPTMSQDQFNKILDLYPEFIRPDILSILEYLKHKQITRRCQDIMIYTNNQAPQSWVHYIKNYFHNKLHYKLFNRVISAFKVNGKRVELCRTSHDKTITDFIRCSKLPKNTEICYLDDVYYPNMNNSNVYYIKVKPYTHDLSFDEMILRFINSNIGKSMIDDDKKEFLIEFIKKK